MTATVFTWRWTPEFLGGVNELIQQTHGPFYHYTNREAAESMGEKGCLWLTRADCFLDEREVHYGIDILLAAIVEIGGAIGEELHRVVDGNVREVLRNAFILSLTVHSDNSFLQENYGQNIVKFDQNFRMLLNGGGFNVKEGLSYQVIYEIYEVFHGKVIYDIESQRELARRVAKAVLDFQSLKFTDASEKDMHLIRLREALFTAVALMKAPAFAPEAEYRICLVRAPNNSNEPIYDQERAGRGKLEGKQIVYTQVFLPTANECISVTYDE
jgi:hypothetical protein